MSGLPRRFILCGFASLPLIGSVAATPAFAQPAADAAVVAFAVHVTAMATQLDALWKVRSDVENRTAVFARRSKARAAERRCDRLDRRLQAAAQELTEMHPTTIRGLAAKARAADATNPHQAFADPWMMQLSASVLLDLVAIGGEA